MFRSKKDVDRHVADVLSKIDSENEKNLRGYTFARLYFQTKDYESAKKYLLGFLSVREHRAAAHKLLAQVYEASHKLENALQSYKRSLEIDSHQSDIVLKICELYCQLSVDHETARYWADRAEQLYPHNEIVFKLRECLVSAEGEANHYELENLIATELASQPKNIGLRIRLLRLYLDTERLKEAYDHATMIESKRLFPFSVDWYYLLEDIFEAYQEEFSQNLDSQFYINFLTALDRLIFLTLSEQHSLRCEDGKKQYSVNDTAAVLSIFDQLLKKATERETKNGSWAYFLHHMKGQLYFYMASLLLKRAKLDQGNRKEAFRFSSGLAVVCYTFKPMNLLQEIWFLNMDENQKTFANFFQEGSLRTSFIGHIIMDMCKEEKSKWLQKLKLEVCVPQVKERIYNRVYASIVHKDKLSSSYFILDSTFENCSLEFPSCDAFQEYDKAAYMLCPDSLHHLVWLELHRQASNGPLYDDNIAEVFKGLQYSNNNLSKGSCESLCILDLEAYLYATVYQAKAILEKKKEYLSPRNQGSQLSYPPNIADAMCSNQQAMWWRAAYGLHACSIKEKLSEYRRELQRGLEVIRGIGNHGMEVQLVTHLARMFAEKAEILTKGFASSGHKRKLVPDNVAALQLRSQHYWNIALGMLEKLSCGQSMRIPKEQMFIGFNKVLSKDEIKSVQEDGKLYLAVYFMNSDKLDEAAELLSKLTSPYGSFYLALTLKKMASQEESFSKSRAIFLGRAKNSIHDTMDRIKDDKSHPLNKELYIVLEDIENELAMDLSLNNSHNEDVDEIDAYDDSDKNDSFYMTPGSHKSLHSTPRPSVKFMIAKPKNQYNGKESQKHFEPSPERLDAQIRALTLNQDTFMKTLLEQQKSFLETSKSIAEALQQNTEVLEQLKKSIDDLKVSGAKNQQRNANRKHSYVKGGQGDEEDYSTYDTNLLEFYTEEGSDDYRNPGYTYNPSSRIVHEAAASLNYVMSPAMPPGPPPGLNHYNYQYPPHAVLPAAPVAERSPYYHPPPGQGLPFSEGQQLPQFHFHVASPVVKPAPPIMSSVASIPQGVTLPPPPPVSLHPPQPVIQPPAGPLSMPSPWSKTVGVPHAFQIPLPSSTPFSPAGIVSQTIPPVSNPSAITSHSELKNLLKSPSTQGMVSFNQTSQQSPVIATNTPTSNVSIFAGILKTPEFSKIERSRCDSDNAGSPDMDGDLEREVMGDFKPLIPLPAEIVVETGEENEVVLFEDRAKLYRFVDQEWKERGLGTVKILHHILSGRVRLLMRRDQVLKVCANHYITSNMEVQPLKSSDRAWTWVAQDFADEELKPEHFCIRFKTVELAVAFKAAFDKAIAISKDTESKNQSPHTSISLTDNSSKPFGTKFLPKAGSWLCPTCYVSNTTDKLLCVACETRKPGSITITECSTSRATGITLVPASVPNPVVSFKSEPTESQFTFGSPATFQTDNTFKTPISSTSASKSVLGGFTFTSSPMIRETESTEMKDREILVVSTKSKNGLQVTKVNQLNSSPFSGFSFVKSPPTISSNLTVQFSDNSRNVTINNVSSTSITTVTPSTTQSNVMKSEVTNESSLSKMQAMVQNISPAYSFEPKDSTNIKLPTSEQHTGSSALPVSSAVSIMSNSLMNTSKFSSDGGPEEFVPTAEFKPVVPLPALVNVKTGEEGEEKLFEEKAKLFRYDLESKEWKERGTGELKILYMTDSQKYRILMRRDQVLKICANHYILPEMKLNPLSNSDRSWVWFAQDYSDGDLVQEQFAVKFKNVEIAEKFYSVFQNCQKELKSASTLKEGILSDKPTVDPCTGNAKAFDELFKSTANSWECSHCHKSNMNLSSCVYCKTPKTRNLTSASQPLGVESKPLSELFKPEAGSWECQACYVRNNSSDNKCLSCESLRPSSIKPNITTPVQNSTTELDNKVPLTAGDKNQSLADLFKPQPGSWECQTCMVRNSPDKTKCASCETVKSGAIAVSSSNSSTGFGTFQFPSLNTSATSSPFTFGKPKSGTGEFVFGIRPTTQPTTFSFGHSTVSNTNENQVFGFKPSLSPVNTSAVFGGTTQKEVDEKNNSLTSIFGGAATSPKFDFGSFTSSQKTDTEPVEFRFGSPQKYEFSFTGVRPRSPVKTPKSPRSPATPSDVDDEDEGDSDVDNIYFQPAIPLPPKVDVKTGEEEEKVLFCKRAKLFRFSSGEWKERGIGDIKILLDEKSNRIRALMRREQVLKVCLNHYITKDIKFEWRGDKSLSWAATDFSESEPSPELLAVRFKTSELAVEFKKAIDDALEKTNESFPASDNIVTKSVNSFSFKTDTPKVESNFSSGLLSRFGTSVQDKSVFGNSSTSSFNFTDAKEATKTSSFFKDKSAPSTFFGQPVNSIFSGSKTAFDKDGIKLDGSQAKETNEEDSDIQVVYEATASTEQIAAAEILRLPKNFFLFEDKEPSCPGCIGCRDIIPPYKEISTDEPKPKESEKPEDLDVKGSSESTAFEGTLFSNSKLNSFSFTDLAANSTFEGLVKTPPSSQNVFAGAGTPLFSNLNNSTENGSDEVAPAPDIHFEPVIPLPDLIEVKTGEEDETEIFIHRAKLFRYDSATKQWKERGIGDIKILRHKEKLRFRIILRRDQVHNVACNHCISEDMALTPLATSENALCWNALDYSDGSGVASQFAVRFKHKEQLNRFKHIFEECQEMLKLEKQNLEKNSKNVPNKTENVTDAKKENVEGVTEKTVNNATDHGTEEQYSDKGSEDEDILFEKRASLEIYDEETDKYQSKGVGNLKVAYDDTCYGYRIIMVNDKGKTLCDHIIAVQTCLRTEGKKAFWAAIELSENSPLTRRQFCAIFSSVEALKEFSKCFEEGKEVAMGSGIVEQSS